MNNDTLNLDIKGPKNETSGTQTKNEGLIPDGAKIKEYGKKSLAPLIDLVGKYKGEVFPYLDAIGKGLKGAASAFESSSSSQSSEQNLTGGQGQGQEKEFSNSDADQAVSGWFREAAEWFEGANEKIKSGKPNELLDYLEIQAQRHPSMMFSSSYIAGLVFGRIGRHIGRQIAKDSPESLDTSSKFGDQSYGSDPMKH